MLLQTFDDFLVERGELPDFILQHLLHVIFPEFAEIIQTDKAFIVPLGHAFLDELDERWPNQLRHHPVVQRLLFLTNLAGNFRRLFHRGWL